jgi:hypothetical protein
MVSLPVRLMSRRMALVSCAPTRRKLPSAVSFSILAHSSPDKVSNVVIALLRFKGDISVIYSIHETSQKGNKKFYAFGTFPTESAKHTNCHLLFWRKYALACRKTAAPMVRLLGLNQIFSSTKCSRTLP